MEARIGRVLHTINPSVEKRYHRVLRRVNRGDLDSGRAVANHRITMRSPGVVPPGLRIACLLAPLALLLPAACSSDPEPPPAGAAGSKAAYDAGDRYGSSLKKGMDRGRLDRVAGDLRGLGRLLEQHMVDQSAYPEASDCAGLLAALAGYGSHGVPSADPWGNPYDCRSAGEGYSLRSSGPDGEPGTGDDVIVEGGMPP